MRDWKPIIQKILSGDTDAFRFIIDDHQRLVMHIVFRMVNNPADREDVSQDIFVKIFQNLKRFKFQSKLSTWIGTIAYNHCVNYLQKKKVPLFEDMQPEGSTIHDIGEQQSSPLNDAEQQDIFHKLEQEIDKLPVHYRTIMTLYHVDELSYAEIGEITGLPEGTVKNYLFRARKIMRKQLSGKYQQEELWQ